MSVPRGKVRLSKISVNLRATLRPIVHLRQQSMLHASLYTEAKKTTEQIYKLSNSICCGKCPFGVFTDFPPGIILIKNMILCEMRIAIIVNEGNKEVPGSEASALIYGHLPWGMLW